VPGAGTWTTLLWGVAALIVAIGLWIWTVPVRALRQRRDRSG